MVLALLRLLETDDQRGGIITVNGVNTRTLGLHDLRRNITYIPRNPVLLPSTIRENIDPVFEFEDEEVWNVL